MKKKFNLSGVSVATWTRTALLVLAVINQLLTSTGHSVLPFSEDEVENLVSAVFTAVTAFVCWWENNSFTDKAQEADKLCHANKKEETVG